MDNFSNFCFVLPGTYNKFILFL